jgi:hypothetical protein
MTYEDVPHDALTANLTVTYEDVLETIKKTKPTANLADIKILEQFTEKNGWKTHNKREQKQKGKLNMFDCIATFFMIFFD